MCPVSLRPGPVLRDVLLNCPLTSIGTEREMSALRRADLWDNVFRMPTDRLVGIRMGGPEGIDRGYAMHRCLDTLTWLDGQAYEKYADVSKKYRNELTLHGRPIRRPSILRILRTWPEEGRRPLVGLHGAVPLDAVIIGLVAQGFDPPKTLEAVFAAAKDLPQNSGGSVQEWVLIECPSSNRDGSA